MLKSSLNRNLEKIVEFNELNGDLSQLCKRMLSSLSEKYLLLESQRNRIFFVSKSQEMKSKMAAFNSEIG